ncbi:MULTISPECIES: T9SS type A sorting domain-containing protein [Aequorivita]|uniref:T9SS type A sorting domain-containing protein n=1 Tax=Aequorivita iocasae TaxID=2803865 RepID=A0ABX7DPY2_9FLAO|nr:MULTISPECIES: T9SS type A sorting domain-containing protein [Aequorivita]QQX75482.1 T9SS type A sorting domain-containing protein [Aequorivita iocasae]UCA54934.1 T9SS type A sorting domain-containing protein [Aequorivita sp. F7]
MKKIKLLLLTVLTASMATAQTTFDLDWFVGVPSANVSISIEMGDTVRWTWTDEVPHSVTSESGSQEDFDSGILTGSGSQFSYTFTETGVNDYKCEVHSGMVGTITVEQTASLEEKFRKNISFYPNPVSNKVTVASLYKLDRYKIYSILGQVIAEEAATGNITEIDMANLESGIYFINASSGELNSTFKVIKQ